MFTVRPFSRSTKPEQAFRVHLSLPALLSLKLRVGDLCYLKLADTDGDGYAIAHQSPEKIQDTIIQTSKTLQELYGFKLGDKIGVSRADQPLKSESSITLLDVTPDVPGLSEEEAEHWAWIAGHILPLNHEAVAARQVVTIQLSHRHHRNFQVLWSDATPTLTMVSAETKFIIRRTPQYLTQLKIPQNLIGGLYVQIMEIQKTMWLVAGYYKHLKLPPTAPTTSGIIVYGAKGTGKTLLIDQIAKSGWTKVIRWQPSERQPSISSSDQPCLIIVEQRLSSLDNSKTIDPIRALFNNIKGLQVLILTETEHPNDIHASLRKVDLFRKEIELPIPSQVDRLRILETIYTDGQPCGIPQWLETAAAKTHGYVGADLKSLLLRATEIFAFRHNPELDIANHGSIENVQQLPSELSLSDVEEAMKSIRPSALQEVFLETPNVRWSDIGGQTEIKRKLQNAVEWPLKQAERMRLLNLRPKKGILLYGPPGCSKTLLVKALACETEFNFLAIKGAELISMYVGESERAVRDVFRKARAASPSIVFFDEIDSIAARGRTELNTLTTLLNEMDGFEELKGVFVVAATNKPAAIDPALMRPGRFDNVVYVGLPDDETRREILFARTAKARVQGVDVEVLVAQTEGYSGSEVVGICETAGEYAMEAERDYITNEDFTTAVAATPRGVTSEMLQEFETWRASRA